MSNKHRNKENAPADAGQPEPMTDNQEPAVANTHTAKKGRSGFAVLLALIAIALSVGIAYYGWQQLQHIKHLASTVSTLQPKNTLARGFAIARKEGVAIHQSDSLSVNDSLSLQFHRGTAEVTVTHVNSPSDE